MWVVAYRLLGPAGWAAGWGQGDSVCGPVGVRVRVLAELQLGAGFGRARVPYCTALQRTVPGRCVLETGSVKQNRSP